jgi:hypothetical protein
MALYEGKLEKVSGGHGVNGGYQRAFVDIGGQRIKNVVLTPYRMSCCWRRWARRSR